MLVYETILLITYTISCLDDDDIWYYSCTALLDSTKPPYKTTMWESVQCSLLQTCLLLSNSQQLGLRSNGSIDKAKVASVNIGKVGRSTVLELGTERLLEGGFHQLVLGNMLGAVGFKRIIIRAAVGATFDAVLADLDFGGSIVIGTAVGASLQLGRDGRRSVIIGTAVGAALGTDMGQDDRAGRRVVFRLDCHEFLQHVIIGTAVCATRDRNHVKSSNGFDRANTVSGICKGLVVGRSDGLVEDGSVGRSKVMEHTLERDLSVFGLALGHVQEGNGAVTGAGEVAGCRRAELGAELVLELGLNIRNRGVVIGFAFEATAELGDGGIIIRAAMSASSGTKAANDHGTTDRGELVIIGTAVGASLDLQHGDIFIGLAVSTSVA